MLEASAAMSIEYLVSSVRKSGKFFAQLTWILSFFPEFHRF